MDDASICRHKIFHYSEYEARFDEIYDLLSREYIYSGEFDKRFKVNTNASSFAKPDQKSDGHLFGEALEELC